MAETKIEWADFTFNPWIGCAKVSPGCAHCYAERDFDHRKGRVRWGSAGTRSVTSAANWQLPLRWNAQAEREGTRPRVFCASLADVFEDFSGSLIGPTGLSLWKCRSCPEVFCGADPGVQTFAPTCPDCGSIGGEPVTMRDGRRRLFALIEATPRLTWLLLTKRPEHAPGMLREALGVATLDGFAERFPHVWVGASVEDQERAEERIPWLLEIPAAVRFLSCEPLLGPLDLSDWLERATACPRCGGSLYRAVPQPQAWCADCCVQECNRFAATGEPISHHGYFDARPAIDWVIAGGESGPGARPLHPGWVRSLRDQCQSAGVAFHFKQWGEWSPLDQVPGLFERRTSPEVGPVLRWPFGWNETSMARIGKKAAGRLLDGRTWDELPRMAGEVEADE